MKNGKLRPLILLALFLSLFTINIAAPATATTATFSDINLVGSQIAIYQVNEGNTTLIGVYNSTDRNVYIPDNENLIISFIPSNTDYFKNPALIPQFLIAMLPAYAGYLVLLVVIGVVGLIFLRRR